MLESSFKYYDEKANFITFHRTQNGLKSFSALNPQFIRVT